MRVDACGRRGGGGTVPRRISVVVPSSMVAKLWPEFGFEESCVSRPVELGHLVIGFEVS